MTGQTVKTSNLGITTTLSANDRVVVLTNPDSSAQTQTITANNLANSTTGNATFAISFPTACQSVTLSAIGSANVAYQLAAPNTTVATIRTGSTTTAISVQYKAIGY